jgi:hypothetical protein
MKNSKISLSFSRFTDAAFLTQGEHVHLNMTGNVYFPDPVPTLADIKIAIDAYRDALTNAKGLGIVPVAIKNQTREALEQLLFQLGMFVMFVANGNETILITSGYTLTKPGEPSYITSLGNVTLENGVSSGQLISSVKAQKAIKSYLHQIATELPTENTVWQSFACSRSKYVFTNLVPGKQYWIRLAAVASNGQTAYSTVASQFVQ